MGYFGNKEDKGGMGRIEDTVGYGYWGGLGGWEATVVWDGIGVGNDDLGYSLIQLMKLTHSRNIFSNTK